MYDSSKDQVGSQKGKEKVSDEALIVRRTYSMRGMEKNVLGDAMKASHKKHAAMKR